MENEVLQWTRYDYAVSAFCAEESLCCSSGEEIASSLVGEELEWCGNQAYLFLASSFFDYQSRMNEMENRRLALQRLLAMENDTTLKLRRLLKQTQRNSEDNEWRLQEQLAHANLCMLQLKDENQSLKKVISELQSKLTDSENILGGINASGGVQLEEDLAISKLRIAELEEEKDCLEIAIANSKKSYEYHGTDENVENMDNPLRHSMNKRTFGFSRADSGSR